MATLLNVSLESRPPGGRRRGGLAASLGSPWVAFALRRLLSLIVILFVLVNVSFLLVRLIPGDPAVLVAGLDASPQQLVIVRHELGLDQSWLAQLLHYWTGLFHGDLGSSFVSGQPVSQIIGERSGASLELAASALVLVLLLSIPIGMVAGALTREGRHRRFDVVVSGTTSVVGAIPEYLTGTFLALVFAVVLNVLPVAGADGWQSLVLPTLAVALRPTAVLIRIVRVETHNVLATDYVRTARSERLPARIVYLRHALPNILTATLTIGGILFSGIVGGAVVVENVFARTGLGTTLVDGVTGRDYLVVQGVILVLGVTVVVVNTVVDVLLSIVDPRSLSREA